MENKQCFLCQAERDELIRINSMETYMQFRIKKRMGRDLNRDVLSSNFICLDCREELREDLERESGVKID